MSPHKISRIGTKFSLCRGDFMSPHKIFPIGGILCPHTKFPLYGGNFMSPHKIFPMLHRGNFVSPHKISPIWGEFYVPTQNFPYVT